MRIGIAATSESLSAVAISETGLTVSMQSPVAHHALQSSFEALLSNLLARPDLRPAWGESSSFITFDVSGLLIPDDEMPIHVVRIAPRPPIDTGHGTTHSKGIGPPLRVAHVAGGHTILGEELVPLDAQSAEQIARDAAPGGRYVISSAGSLVNPAHELRIGDLFLTHAEPSSIDFSHNFHNSAIAVRERTAIANSSLFASAEAIGTMLALTAGRLAPQLRLFVTTNDGGCVPLSRLSLSPVHSRRSAQATELIGAAAICGVEDGRIVYTSNGSANYGEVISGVPTVVPTHRGRSGLAIASQTANVVPASATTLVGHQQSPLLLLMNDGPSHLQEHMTIAGTTLPVHASTDIDLRALGAACAPLADWTNRVVNVSNAREMEHLLAAARSRVEARLVSFGAKPSRIRTVESRVLATAYQHPRVVSVRVRGVAGRGSSFFPNLDSVRRES